MTEASEAVSFAEKIANSPLIRLQVKSFFMFGLRESEKEGFCLERVKGPEERELCRDTVLRERERENGI